MADGQIVIVGGGLAAAKAAQTLRDEGHDGPLALVAAEPHLPYERPPLSKGYLLGTATLEDARVHDAAYYRDQDIDLRLGTRAAEVDVVTHEVVLDGGERLGYAKLLLATGATPRRLPVPGAELPGVLYLRDIADAEALAAALRGSPRVVIVGGGWIGCEVAAAARTHGADVTIIEPEDVPLRRVLGERMGAFFRDVHVAQGVRVLTGTGVDMIEGGGRVERVWTSDRRMLHADLVVVGIGVQPVSELAERAGLAVVDGSKSTRGCARASRTSSRPATSPASPTGSSGRCVSSTGRTRCTRVRPPRGACSAPRSRSTASRTSSPTSTTSAWSTRAMRPARPSS